MFAIRSKTKGEQKCPRIILNFHDLMMDSKKNMKH